jgi:hypothetical protein
VPFVGLYKISIGMPDEIFLQDKNTSFVMFATLDVFVTNMLAMSGCCRMIKNTWTRFAVIFFYVVVAIISIVRTGAIADNQPFLEQFN